MNYVAEGYNSFDTKKAPSGVVRYLPDPKSVLALIQSGKLKEHILLVQGGTTTFLAPCAQHGRDRRYYHVRRAGIAFGHSVARIPDALRDDSVSRRLRFPLRDGGQQ